MAGKSAIITVERHKVRTGESLDSIARSAGVTWQDLATFNWGTANPDEINQHLRDEVGCTKKTANGANYVFTDSDRPGIILVPHPWSQEDLRTDRVHKVKVEPLMLVVDYEFRRDGDNTNLSFTVRGRQPAELFVRLYECNTKADLNQREDWIRTHAAEFRDEPGYQKSGRYCEVQDGDSLESLASAHGIANAGQIRTHFENGALRELRGNSFSVEAGDFVFVPQLMAADRPIPLGPLLPAAASGEQATGGTRYTAVWNNEESSYDPLDWTSWLAETPSSIPVMRDLEFPSRDSVGSRWYVPQFAVLTGDFLPIGVSPPPLWLVHLAQFEQPSDSDAFHVFLADSEPRPMSGTTAEFEGPEAPLTFYSALNPEAGDQETGQETS